MAGLCELHRMFKQTEQQKVFRFWINLIKDSSVYADQILKILRSCFHEILRSELVELATYPAVRNNKDFIKYLMETYDVKTLQVYGFDVEEKYLKRKISAAPESDSTVPHHLLTSFKTK